MDDLSDTERKRIILEKQRQDISEFKKHILKMEKNDNLSKKEQLCDNLLVKISGALVDPGNWTSWNKIEEFQRIWKRDILNQKIMKSPKKSKK